MNPTDITRREARAQFKTLRGSHPEERRVRKLLRAGLVAALEPCTQPLLIGATGLGKTDLVRRVTADFVAEFGRNAVAYVNVPPGNKKDEEYDIRPVCRHILREVGRPAQLVAAIGPAPWDSERSTQTLVDATRDELVLRQPGVLTLDEIERLVPKGKADELPLDTIAWWADLAQVPIQGIGNYDAVLTLKGSKLFRRQLVVHYQPYEGADGYRPYLEGMVPIVKHLRSTSLVAQGIDWDEVCRALYAASHGRVGESKRVLEFALDLSSEPITRADIVDAMEARLSQPAQTKFDQDLERGRKRLAGLHLDDEPPAPERVPTKSGPRIGRGSAIIPTGLAARP